MFGVTDIMGGGAGYGPRVETDYGFKCDEYCDGGTESKKAHDYRAQRDDMIGENGCLQNVAWRINAK